MTHALNGMFRTLTLTCALIILIAGVGANSPIVSRASFQAAQASNTSQKLLDVVLPDSAIIRLDAGSSYTGQLTDFQSSELTLSVNGSSRAFPLAQISDVEFQGDVWIPNGDGSFKRGVIRGLTQTLVGVPVNALELENNPTLGKLDLDTVLTLQEYEQFSSNPARIHAIKELLFTAQDEMTVKVVAVRR